MNKFFQYIIWPAVAGLIFAIVLLQMPRAVQYFPGLSAYYPSPTIEQPQVIQAVISSYSTAIKRAAPAVVSISSQQIVFRSTDPDKSNNLGSGVIISPDGYIISSFHIIYTSGTFQLSESSTVTLTDGRSFAARPVALDEANDLALYKVNADNLPYLGFTDQNALEVGDITLAIGNPRNVGQSASMGIVSALLNRGDSYVIQTDAAINPGNSGGALIDIQGSLIGINSTIVSESGGSEGIGFSIPAYKAFELLETYLNSEPSGYLGVDATALPVLDGLKRFDQVVQGLLVNFTTDNSPASISGIQAGDLIMAVNDQKLVIASENDTYKAITAITDYGPEETVILEILRDQNILQIPVTLGVGEPSTYIDLLDEEDFRTSLDGIIEFRDSASQPTEREQ